MNTSLEPTFDKKVDCPFCNHQYKTKKVRSQFKRPINTDTDFCSDYKDEAHSPLLYVISVCPECGYSFSEHFNPYFLPGTKEAIQTNIANKWTKQDYTDNRSVEDAIKTYKLGIFTAMLKQEKAVVIAGLYLRLGWIFRKLNKDQEEFRFIRLAAESYEKAYEEDDFRNSDMNPLRVLYLIGELNRRLGNLKEAVSYFSQVVDKKDLASDPKIIEMAREQWFKTREENKEED